jgi:MFS family permease
MVTAILPSLTDDSNSEEDEARARIKALQNATARSSIAFSVESEATITQERYTQSVSERSMSDSADSAAGRPSKLAGFVGLFTGCGALVALTLFLPLPAKFGEDENTTPAEAVSYSFYVVAVVALAVSLFVAIGLRNIKGEEGKGFRVLFGLKDENESARSDGNGPQRVSRAFLSTMCAVTNVVQKLAPYLHLMKDSVFLGFVDSRIGLGYVGGFVARASSVAISLFIPLFVNTYYISNGFCKGSPHDSSPELKEECKTAYILSSILTGVAQFMGLICAPIFGYLASRTGRINYPIVVSTVFGIVGYTVLPQLASPEIKDIDGRGGSPIIFLVVSLLGISQIGAIVCSLGSLGRGVLAVELPRTTRPESLLQPEDYESANDESRPLISITTDQESVSRIRLKGSIAGVYSLYGGFAILLLTKLGGYLFDTLSNGAPFYMMAIFNAVLLAFSLGMDASRTFSHQA